MHIQWQKKAGFSAHEGRLRSVSWSERRWGRGWCLLVASGCHELRVARPDLRRVAGPGAEWVCGVALCVAPAVDSVWYLVSCCEILAKGVEDCPPALQNTLFLANVPLCLPRACLGKTIVYVYTILEGKAYLFPYKLTLAVLLKYSSPPSMLQPFQPSLPFFGMHLQAGLVQAPSHRPTPAF